MKLTTVLSFISAVSSLLCLLPIEVSARRRESPASPSASAPVASLRLRGAAERSLQTNNNNGTASFPFPGWCYQADDYGDDGTLGPDIHFVPINCTLQYLADNCSPWRCEFSENDAFRCGLEGEDSFAYYPNTADPDCPYPVLTCGRAVRVHA